MSGRAHQERGRSAEMASGRRAPARGKRLIGQSVEGGALLSCECLSPGRHTTDVVITTHADSQSELPHANIGRIRHEEVANLEDDDRWRSCLPAQELAV